MQHAISWFEIPTENLDRATQFYETILGLELQPMDMPGMQMRIFPIDNMMEGVTGVLIKTEDGFHKPSSSHGPLVYLNANAGMVDILSKVESAGGQILQDRMQISPEHGYMAIILDSEGNRIAFHSVN